MAICTKESFLLEYLIATELDKSLPDDSASWEQHILTCPSCAHLSKSFKNIRSELMSLAEEDIALACNDMTAIDLAVYISQNDSARLNATARRVSEHIKTCSSCTDTVQMCTPDGDKKIDVESRQNNLAEVLVKSLQSGTLAVTQGGFPFPNWLHRAFELFCSKTTLVPALDVALGSGFLRAFQPLHSVVRQPFVFSWASNRHAKSFELIIYELDNNDQIAIKKIIPPSPTGLQQISSEKIGYVFRHDNSYCWSVSALDNSGKVLAETNPICFFPKDIILDKKRDSVIINHKPLQLEGVCNSLDEAIRLAEYSLYDESMMILIEQLSSDKKLRAACLVGILEHRMAICLQGCKDYISPMHQIALGNVHRHLHASLATWEAKLARLIGM